MLDEVDPFDIDTLHHRKLPGEVQALAGDNTVSAAWEVRIVCSAWEVRCGNHCGKS